MIRSISSSQSWPAARICFCFKKWWTYGQLVWITTSRDCGGSGGSIVVPLEAYETDARYYQPLTKLSNLQSEHLQYLLRKAKKIQNDPFSCIKMTVDEKRIYAHILCFFPEHVSFCSLSLSMTSVHETLRKNNWIWNDFFRKYFFRNITG